MKGADFPVLTLSGERTTFIKKLKGDTILVMFYDLDCEQCKEISTQLSRTPLPKTLKIFAIDVAGGRSLWEKNFLNSSRLERSDGKVILKDPTLDMILQKR